MTNSLTIDYDWSKPDTLRKWLDDQNEVRDEELRQRDANAPPDSPKQRACGRTLPLMYATDVEVYLRMTLVEIAEEWMWDDPIHLLAVLVKADQERDKQRAKDPHV